MSTTVWYEVTTGLSIPKDKSIRYYFTGGEQGIDDPINQPSVQLVDIPGLNGLVRLVCLYEALRKSSSQLWRV